MQYRTEILPVLLAYIRQRWPCTQAACNRPTPPDSPFSKEIPDADLWLPSSKQAAVDALLDALGERASVVLTGEPGVGKTCVLRALRHRIPTAGFRLTYCHNATLGRRDFYRQLCIALGLQPKTGGTRSLARSSTSIETA